jgi:hypothetical protein
MAGNQGFQGLSDFLDYIHSIGSSTAHDVAAGYSGVQEAVRARNAEAAKQAVERVQARSFSSPGAQSLAEALGGIGRTYAKASWDLLPDDIQQELSRLGRNTQETWERITSSSPAAGAALAGIGGVIGGPEEEAAETAYRRVRQSVADPLRQAAPGIYKDPRQIAREAEARLQPESPLLKQVYGVTREELAGESQAAGPGNIPGYIPGTAAMPRGPQESAAATRVMTPANARRMQNILYEGQRLAPGVTQGMDPFYWMHPQYRRLAQLYDQPEALRRYGLINALSGMSSPQTMVPNELARGSAAYMLNEQGRFPDWVRYGGNPSQPPLSLQGVGGTRVHPSQVIPMQRYLSGRILMDPEMAGPKTGPYIWASSIPELGRQTNVPIGDVHWSGGMGLGDVRTSGDYWGSASAEEMRQLAPWFRQQVTDPLGLEAVPGQARMWGYLGPQTGVKTALGVPKLELSAIQIGKAADRLGVSPETARDLFLMGKTQAGNVDPTFLKWLAGASGAAGLGMGAYQALQGPPDQQPSPGP